MICVIEDISDLWTFERIGFYRGMYHVLGGTLSAINGIGVEELNVNQLVQRIVNNNVKVVGISVNTSGMTKNKAIEYLASVEDKMKLPTVDPVLIGTSRIAEKLANF